LSLYTSLATYSFLSRDVIYTPFVFLEPFTTTAGTFLMALSLRARGFWSFLLSYYRWASTCNFIGEESIVLMLVLVSITIGTPCPPPFLRIFAHTPPTSTSSMTLHYA
jgi:hypothetical protein